MRLHSKSRRRPVPPPPAEGERARSGRPESTSPAIPTVSRRERCPQKGLHVTMRQAVVPVGPARTEQQFGKAQSVPPALLGCLQDPRFEAPLQRRQPPRHAKTGLEDLLLRLGVPGGRCPQRVVGYLLAAQAIELQIEHFQI